MHVLDSTAGHAKDARGCASPQRCDAPPRGRRRAGVVRLAALRRVCSPLVPVLPHAAAGLSAVVGLLPGRAWAHVKWFEAYDVARPPVPIVGGVFTARYLLVLAGFALLVAGGFLLDRLAARSGRKLARLERGEEVEERLMRAGTGAFFVALFATGGVILTPELRTEAGWVEWLQLGVAASMLSARTCALGAAGILALYGHAVARYGVFHLADYPVFLGLAAYLALTSCAALVPAGSERPRSLRMPVLYAAVCTSLMWGAIEKWAYPQRFFALIEQRPYLALGLPPEDFVVLAGFVEFALAFYILTGLGLLRLGILGLGSIFALAIVDFGKLDAVGHLPILVPLAAMFLHGPTPLHRRLHDARRGLWAEGRRAGAGFAAAICFFFAAYYGLQHMEHGGAAGVQRHAALAEPARAQAR